MMARLHFTPFLRVDFPDLITLDFLGRRQAPKLLNQASTYFLDFSKWDKPPTLAVPRWAVYFSRWVISHLRWACVELWLDSTLSCMITLLLRWMIPIALDNMFTHCVTRFCIGKDILALYIMFSR